MRRAGIINAQLAAALARLRHTDLLVVADSGLPLPAGCELIDLGLVYGVPPFATVLEVVLGEIVVEHVTVAAEAEDANPDVWARAKAIGAPVESVPHEAFKRATAAAVAVVRSGEATPFSNLILRCGVPFG